MEPVGRARRIAETSLTSIATAMGIAAYMEDRWKYFAEHPVFHLSFLAGAAMIGGSIAFWYMSSKVDDGREEQRVRILANNDAMFIAIEDLLRRSPESIEKVTVIQYTGVNVVSSVRRILEKTRAEVDVYLVEPSRAVNLHQQSRARDLREKLANELHGRDTLGTWRQFTYDAPGSIRAVLIHGKMLFVGSYLYEVVGTLGESTLDIRGGEMPLLAVPSSHPEFQTLTRAIEHMLKNWTEVKDAKGNVTAVRYPSVAG